MQKWVAFLYTSNRLSDIETKKTIVFTIASKKYMYIAYSNPFDQGSETLVPWIL